METMYHRRGYSQHMSRESSSPGQFTTKIPSKVEKKVKELIENFTKEMGKLIAEFTMLDHYSILDLMRKNAIFQEVATLIQHSLYSKIETLTKENRLKDKKIIALKREERSKVQSNQSSHMDKLSNEDESLKNKTSKSFASNLYFHARALSEEEFINFYQKRSLSNALILTKVSNLNKNETIFKNTEEKTLENDFQYQEKVEKVLCLCKNSPHFNEIKLILCSDNKASIGEDGEKSSQEKKQSNETKVKENEISSNHVSPLLLGSPSNLQTRKISFSFSSKYKNDKSEEYFNRYYRGSNFNVNEVTSITKTKNEEIKRIENEYEKNLRIRRRIGQMQHRYSVSFTKDEL